MYVPGNLTLPNSGYFVETFPSCHFRCSTTSIIHKTLTSFSELFATVVTLNPRWCNFTIYNCCVTLTKILNIVCLIVLFIFNSIDQFPLFDESIVQNVKLLIVLYVPDSTTVCWTRMQSVLILQACQLLPC